MSLSKVTSSGNCFRYSTISLPSRDVISMVALTFIIHSCFIPVSYKYMNILPMRQKNILPHDIHQLYFKYQHGMSRYGIPSVRPVRELPRNPYFPFVAHLHMLQGSREAIDNSVGCTGINIKRAGNVVPVLRGIEDDLVIDLVPLIVGVLVGHGPVIFIPSCIEDFYPIGEDRSLPGPSLDFFRSEERRVGKEC